MRNLHQGRRRAALARENRRLTQHLREEVDAQTHYLTLLIQERKDLMAELVHDVRSPLTSLLNFSRIVERNDILLGDETCARMRVIEEKCTVLSGRLQSLQELVKEADQSPVMEPLSLNALLTEFYWDSKPVVELPDPNFLLETPCWAAVKNCCAHCKTLCITPRISRRPRAASPSP